MATEETTITELELAEEVLADMVIPVDTSTDTKSVSLKQLRAWLGSSLPTGFIIASFGKMDDERFTLLDGKTLSKQGTYGAFCAKVEAQVQAGKWYACSEEEYNADLLASGQCSKFVIGVDYVRIPKLGNSLCSGVVDGKIPVFGNGLSLGLTDGTNNGALGRVSNQYLNTSIPTFGQPVGTTFVDTNTKNDKTVGITTDPTKSGIEAKINSVEVFYYMVISTEGQTAEVQIDINKVYEDLNLKANSDLSNVASVASSFKEASIEWGMPDYSARIAVSAFPFTAPATGELWASATGSGENIVKIDDASVMTAYVASAYGQATLQKAVMKKGEIAILEKGAFQDMYFYPFKGVN